MPKPWTAELVKKALGVQKCNGSLDAATEDLPLEKAIGVAKEKEASLTGADLKARTREVIGTCVAMRVKIDGHQGLQIEPGVAQLVQVFAASVEFSEGKDGQILLRDRDLTWPQDLGRQDVELGGFIKRLHRILLEEMISPDDEVV